MQKLFTALAAAALSAPVFAADLDFTFTPASGEKIEALSSFQLNYSSSLNGVEPIDADAVTIKKDGATLTGYTWKCKDNESGATTFTLQDNVNYANATITEPGAYVITIPANSLSIWDESWNEISNPSPYEISYIIEAEPEVEDEFTFDPVSGSTVKSISSFKLKYDASACYGVEPNNADDITISKDGSPLTGYHWDFSDAGTGTTTFTLQDADYSDTSITEPGTYVITIPKGSLLVYDDTEEGGTNAKAYEITYIIEAPAYTVTPAAGTVKKLNEVTIAGDAAKFSALTASATVLPTITKDNQAYECTVAAASEGAVLTYTITPAPAEAGNYKVSIPAGAFTFTPLEGEPYANDAIELDYTLVNLPPVVYDLTVTRTSPAAGEVDLESRQFETVNITMSDANARPDTGKKCTMVCENAGYSEEADIRYSYGSICTVAFRNITKNGTYTFTVPEGTFGDAEWQADHETGHANAAFTCTFTVVGGAGSEATYDAQVLKTKPAAGDVDLEMVQFDSVTITIPQGMNVREDSPKATLTCEGANYSSEGAFKFVMNDFTGNVLLLAPFQNLTVDGDYTLTIPRGTFGDAEWQADPVSGHANDTYTCTFHVTGGIPQTTAVLDLKPTSVEPGENATSLAQIVLVFPEGTQVKDGAAANLSCTEANYYENMLIRATETSGTFTLTPAKAPEKDGVYMLLIKSGIFGDADYMANDKTGHTNDEITHSWNLTVNSVDSILMDATYEDGVYDFRGVRVGDSLRGLPAGMYIVKGHKVVVK